MANLYVLIEIYTNNFFYGFLNVVSILSILCGISVIVAKNPVVSVLFLIGLFFSIASYLMLLGLNFIGLSYLLVYVGAVSILFLFILMLINVRISELVTDNNNSFFLAILIGILLFVPIKTKGSLFNTFGYFNSVVTDHSLPYANAEQGEDNLDANLISSQHTNVNSSDTPELMDELVKLFSYVYDTNGDILFFVTSKMWDGTLGELSHITSIGSILYTNYPIWLILTSIILLLAMVGAIIITIKK